jgi:uncharacterized phage protein (TIGR01671 family)
MSNRIFKFRAWDGAKMLYSEKGDFYLVYNGIQVPSSTGHEFYFKDYPVMQSTGLLDINGTEIFEGDVIINEAKVVYVVRFGFCQKNAFTGWYAEGINISHEGAINNDSDSDRNSYIEVIGNVHQRPHLVTKEQEA